jgi:hypothetical protein
MGFPVIRRDPLKSANIRDTAAPNPTLDLSSIFHPNDDTIHGRQELAEASVRVPKNGFKTDTVNIVCCSRDTAGHSQT